MWLLTGANGYTLDPNLPRFEAVAVDGERILAVGSTHELKLQFAATADRIIDVQGATVVPGLVDSHLHIAFVGEQSIRLNLVGVASKEDMLQRIRSYAASLPEGEWIVGGGWDDNLMDGRRLPTLEELNAASKGRPLLLSRICSHAFLANESAFHSAGVTHLTPDPADGTYGRDSNGQLNGLIYENAVAPLQRSVPKWGLSQYKKAVRAGMRLALQSGITAVHTDDVRSLGSFEAVWTLYHELLHEENIPLRIHELVDWHAIDECNLVLPHLPAPNDWLDVGAAKLFSDGALGGRTAWFLEDYTDAPGWRGTPMYPREVLAERVRAAHEKGFAVAIHAIGDAGLDATLAAMSSAGPIQRRPGVAFRDRVVHAEVVNPDLISRMVAMGDQLAVDIQPRFTVSDFPWIVERIGEHRLNGACAWKTLRGAGLHLAGGSDAPIEPISPLLGMHAAVTRRKPDESHPGYTMAEAITPMEALSLFTHEACFANHSEHHKGVVKAGWLADFTVLDRDIAMPVHVDDIRDAAMLQTIVGGKTAYDTTGGARAE